MSHIQIESSTQHILLNTIVNNVSVPVESKTQHIVVNPATASVSIINAGPIGPPGVIGPPGPPGPDGVAGTEILVGQGLPSNSLGKNGDLYIDSISGKFYGPKQNNIWPGTAFYNNSNQRFVYTQASPASTWTITHNLGGRPSVTVVDSAQTEVVGETQYISDTQIVINFSHPFSGQAYLT